MWIVEYKITNTGVALPVVSLAAGAGVGAFRVSAELLTSVRASQTLVHVTTHSRLGVYLVAILTQALVRACHMNHSHNIFIKKAINQRMIFDYLI